MSLQQHEKDAIHDFLIQVTLPILGMVEGEERLIGTGTLFKIAGRRFLITAGHTLDSFHIDDWLVPVNPRGGPTRRLVEGDAIRPVDDNADVMVVELKHAPLIAELERNCRFLTLENIWVPDYSADAVFVAGFPCSRTRKGEDNKLHGRLFVLRSQFRKDIPEAALRSEDAVTNGVDFFVNHKDAINELTTEYVGREALHGMSGCAVWGYRARGWTKHGVWSPEAVLKVIGVQSAFAENQYIRAKSWGAVLATLVLINEELRGEARRRADQILKLIGHPSKETAA